MVAVERGEAKRVRFLPLAVADMKGEARCVAGVDVDTRVWIRPVKKDYRSLFEEQAALFQPNHVHHLLLGSSQPRSQEDDPLGYHTEDRVLLAEPECREQVSPKNKLQLLEGLRDDDLNGALRRGGRSLVLVRPETFEFHPPRKEPRFLFSSSLPATYPTRPRRFAWFTRATPFNLEKERIAVSPNGPKCTCRWWIQFAQARWRGRSVNEDVLRRSFPEARLYLVVSLTALFKGCYWLVVAGVHVVDETKTWL